MFSSNASHPIKLHNTVQYYTILFYTSLYYSIVLYTIVHYTVLYIQHVPVCDSWCLIQRDRNAASSPSLASRTVGVSISAMWPLSKTIILFDTGNSRNKRDQNKKEKRRRVWNLWERKTKKRESNNWWNIHLKRKNRKYLWILTIKIS